LGIDVQVGSDDSKSSFAVGDAVFGSVNMPLHHAMCDVTDCVIRDDVTGMLLVYALFAYVNLLLMCLLILSVVIRYNFRPPHGGGCFATHVLVKNSTIVKRGAISAKEASAYGERRKQKAEHNINWINMSWS
jgi:hypothetical protein